MDRARSMHLVERFESVDKPADQSETKKYSLNQIDIRYGKLAMENIINRIIALRPDLAGTEEMVRNKRKILYGEELVKYVRQVVDFLQGELRPGESFREDALNHALDKYFSNHRFDITI